MPKAQDRTFVRLGNSSFQSIVLQHPDDKQPNIRCAFEYAATQSRRFLFNVPRDRNPTQPETVSS